MWLDLWIHPTRYIYTKACRSLKTVYFSVYVTFWYKRVVRGRQRYWWKWRRAWRRKPARYTVGGYAPSSLTKAISYYLLTFFKGSYITIFFGLLKCLSRQWQAPVASIRLLLVAEFWTPSRYECKRSPSCLTYPRDCIEPKSFITRQDRSSRYIARVVTYFLNKFLYLVISPNPFADLLWHV